MFLARPHPRAVPPRCCRLRRPPGRAERAAGLLPRLSRAAPGRAGLRYAALLRARRHRSTCAPSRAAGGEAPERGRASPAGRGITPGRANPARGAAPPRARAPPRATAPSPRRGHGAAARPTRSAARPRERPEDEELLRSARLPNAASRPRGERAATAAPGERVVRSALREGRPESGR